MSGMHDFAEGDVNKILFSLSAGLSILGCILTVLTYLIFKDLQTTSRHIIVCISISDFITCVAYIPGFASEPDQTNICILQSFVSSSFIQSSFLWTVALAIFLYITIARENKILADRLVWPWFHLVCWLLPLLINLVALNLHMLGNTSDETSSGWCWITVYNTSQDVNKKLIMWMLIDGKGIEITSYFLVIIFYLLVKIHLKKSIKFAEQADSSSSQFLCQRTIEVAKSADCKLLFVPVCFVLLRIWGTIRFFFYIFQYHGGGKILLHMQTIGDNLQGFVNCILFCLLTTKVRKHIQNCLCCKMKEDSSDTQRFVAENESNSNV